MRLINADNLECKMIEVEDSDGYVLVVKMSDIDSSPTIKETEARWKGAGMGDYRCSLCDVITSGQPNYCPNCGAKMDKEV